MPATGSIVGGGVYGFGLPTPHPTTTARAAAGQAGPDSLGMRGSPKAGLGYQSWKRGGMSASFVSPLPSRHESPAVQTAFAALPTCIPDWSQPGPSCIPGTEQAEGPGLFVLPKSGLEP